MNERRRAHRIAMIPARIGSERLRWKNLAMLSGRPLIAYAIEAALQAGCFDRVVVDTDSEAFAPITEELGAELYLRPLELGSSETRSDDVVHDFLRAHPTDIVAWVNSVSPLQTPAEIASAVSHLEFAGLDSLITVERRSVHVMHEGDAVNFSRHEKFAKTQDLSPVQLFTYSTMVWRAETFLDAFEATGTGMFCGRFGTFEVGREAGLLVKTADDLHLVESVMGRRRARRDDRVEYASSAFVANGAAR